MSRHRKPRPPGNVEAFCTGRGTHERVDLRRLQLKDEGTRVRVFWDKRQGPAPVTGYRDADGWYTFDLQCGDCRHHFKRREDWLATALLALAVHYGITGDDNSPIPFDVSTVKKA